MEVNIGEALRYLGADEHAPAALRATVGETARQLAGALQPRHVWRVFPLLPDGEGLLLEGPDLRLTGRLALSMLEGCERAVLLICTLGARFDALLREAEARDMASAAILNACGSAFVETGCDEAEREIALHFPELFPTDRFSPGYGDLPLALQPGICAALDAARRVGVHVGESLLMTPVKTVTAVIGLSDTPRPARIRGCAHCAMRETCSLPKGDKCHAIEAFE